MASDGKGGSHELQVRGVTDSNVVAMKATIGHSGSLSSANFLVREELELVTEEGPSVVLNTNTHAAHAQSTNV